MNNIIGFQPKGPNFNIHYCNKIAQKPVIFICMYLQKKTVASLVLLIDCFENLSYSL